jgi:hypothetical protein
MSEVKTTKPALQAELNLKTCTSKFAQIYTEELRSYSYQLFEYRNKPDVNKSVIMKLITFLYDLINGINVTSDQYDTNIESLGIKNME